jgi:hypothetical protein
MPFVPVLSTLNSKPEGQEFDVARRDGQFLQVEWNRLRQQMDQTRITFIQIDIELAMVFGEMAARANGMGHDDRFQRLLEHMKRADRVIETLLQQVIDPNEQQPLREQHQKLTQTLDDLQRLRTVAKAEA